MNPYPPEYDDFRPCQVCGKDPSTDCECPTCRRCQQVGNPKCTVNGGPGCRPPIMEELLYLMFQDEWLDDQYIYASEVIERIFHHLSREEMDWLHEEECIEAFADYIVLKVEIRLLERQLKNDREALEGLDYDSLRKEVIKWKKVDISLKRESR